MDVRQAFDEHRGFLWSLAYRMTGNGADADDVVQETFVRALEHPPARTDEPWRPWLVRVAVNLARDLLRRRKRRQYVGVWLPAPVDTAGLSSPDEPSARYDLLESAGFAFLLALEALTPAQRAVLLLRDVFELSVKETAEALGVSEANVKTTHLRARKALQPYDEHRARPTRRVQESTRAALEGLMAALARGDAPAVESLLAADVRSFADGGGVYFAARAPVAGRAAVARLYLGLASKAGRLRGALLRMVGGLPALVIDMDDTPSGWAPRAVIQVQLDGDGRVARIYSLMAPGKMGALA